MRIDVKWYLLYKKKIYNYIFIELTGRKIKKVDYRLEYPS